VASEEGGQSISAHVRRPDEESEQAGDGVVARGG
jgi:hypothetical protein